MTSRYIRDLVERVLSTYCQSFLGLLLASGFGVDGVLDLSWSRPASPPCPRPCHS